MSPTEWPQWGLLIATTAALVILGTWNYPLFHNITEMFSVAVAVGSFAVAWHMRRRVEESYLVMLGIAALSAGSLDLFHGAPLEGIDHNHSIQFMLAAHLLEAFAFLLAASLPRRRFPPQLWAWIFLLLTLAMMVCILAFPIFPATRLADGGFAMSRRLLSGGYLVCTLATLGLLRRHRDAFDGAIFWWLSLGALLRLINMGGEMQPISWQEYYEIIGHIAKIGAAVCLFRAIAVAGMIRPKENLDIALRRERDLSGELTGAAQRLEAIVDSIPDLLFLFECDGSLAFANPAAVELFNLPRPLPPHQDWRALRLPAELMEGMSEQISQLLRQGNRLTGQARYAGRVHDYVLRPLFDCRHQVRQILAVVRDVTDRVTTQEILRVAMVEAEQGRLLSDQLADARTRFMAAASHDLRQPLQAIRLYLDLIGLKLGNSEHRNLVERALQALDNGENLLKSLLDLSTLQAGAVKPQIADVPIITLMEKLFVDANEQASSKNLVLHIVPSTLTLRTDPLLLQRILRNLLLNAIRYTNKGRIVVGCRRQGQKARIDVYDTGVGIPLDQQGLIFEEFVRLPSSDQNRAEGLGLGLSIVQRTARLLNHPLTLQSKPGQGSRFSITVPLANPTTVSPQRVAAAPPSPSDTSLTSPAKTATRENRTILLIEDDELQLAAQTELIRDWGFIPLAATDVTQAMALTEVKGLPDGIITDFRLPGEISGLMAIKHLRTLAQGPLPALLTTGDTAPSRLRAAAEAGIEVLHKPYTAADLKQALTEMFL